MDCVATQRKQLSLSTTSDLFEHWCVTILAMFPDLSNSVATLLLKLMEIIEKKYKNKTKKTLSFNYSCGVRDVFLSPPTYWADSGRRSSDARGTDAVLQGACGAQLGGSSSRDLWGSWGGVGWLALGCLRLGRQVQWLCTLTVLQKPKQHSFACCDHRRNLEAGGRGRTPRPPSPRPLAFEAVTVNSTRTN